MDAGTPDKNCISNVDITHVVVDLSDTHSLVMAEDVYDKFENVVSRVYGKKSIVFLEINSKAHLEIQIITFLNECCADPIEELSTNVLGVC